MKIYPIAKRLPNQIRNYSIHPQRYCQRLSKFCHCGKISPSPVTCRRYQDERANERRGKQIHFCKQGRRRRSVNWQLKGNYAFDTDFLRELLSLSLSLSLHIFHGGNNSLYKLRGRGGQCDQIRYIIFYYLATCNNENLPNRIFSQSRFKILQKDLMELLKNCQMI